MLERTTQPYKNTTFNHYTILNTLVTIVINNTNAHNGSHVAKEMTPPKIQKWFLLLVLIMYVISIMVGFLGNAMVCYFLVTRKEKKRSIHLLTLNLAISDLIVTVIYLPTQLYTLSLHLTWGLGNTICRIVYGVNSCTVNASIGTLIVITYDRYNAVTRPLLSHTQNTRKTKILICAVWVTAVLITVPLWIVAKVNMGYCSEIWSSSELETAYWTGVFVVQLPLPMLFISIAYGAIIYSFKNSYRDVELKGKLLDQAQHKGATELISNACSSKEVLYRKMIKRRLLPDSLRRRRRKGSNRKRKKQKHKLLTMSIVLVITYGVCVTPQHAVFFAWKYGSLADKPYAAFVFILSNLLMSMNSAINPCIYGTLNDELKSSIIIVLKKIKNRLHKIIPSRNFRDAITRWFSDSSNKKKLSSCEAKPRPFELPEFTLMV